MLLIITLLVTKLEWRGVGGGGVGWRDILESVCVCVCQSAMGVDYLAVLKVKVALEGSHNQNKTVSTIVYLQSC